MNRWHRHEALEGKLRPREPAPLSPEARAKLRARASTARGVRDEERRRRQVGLVLTAIVAALAHVAVLLPALSYWFGAGRGEATKTEVRMVSLPKGAWQQNPQGPALEHQEQEAPPEPRKEREPDDEERMPAGQLVSLPRSRDEAPEHADYAAQDDHRAERETRSRHQTQFYDNATHKPQVGADEEREVVEESDTEAHVARGADARPGGPEGKGRALTGDSGTDTDSGAGSPKLALEIPRQAARDRIALRESEEGRVVNQEREEAIDSSSDRFEVSLGMRRDESQRPGDGLGESGTQGMQGGAGAEGLPSLAQLTPSLTDLERISGMPANDALDEVETDAETRLNAWRWKHATFFDRLKKGVNRHWRGLEVYVRHDPTRETYGTKRLLTWLTVTIDKDGNVTEIGVLQESGADFLDEEAIRTMRAAAPFVNPPPALFGSRDTFTFRFGFEIRNEWRHVDLDWRPY